MRKERVTRFVWQPGDLVKMPETPEEASALFDKEEEDFLEEATEEELEEQ